MSAIHHAAHNRIDIAGKTFGRITVLSFHSADAGGSKWSCRCSCGKEVVTYSGPLRRSRTVSCGCLRTEKTAKRSITHGLHSGGRHPLERCWSSMKTRCLNPKAKRYPDYGGRGVTICDRWMHGEGGKPGFQCFVEDIGPRPSPEHSIDRRDNDGPYAPWNCRWATRKEQRANRRDKSGRRLS